MAIRQICLAFALAGLVATIPAQGLDQEITVNLPPQPVSRLVDSLAKQTGTDLEVAKAVANDIVMVHVKGVPLSQVMQKIASVTNRTWDQKDKRYILTTSSEAERAAERAVVRRRAEILKRAVAKMVASPVYQQPWTQEEAIKLATQIETIMNPSDGHLDMTKIRLEEFHGRSPAERAIQTILAQMAPADLALAFAQPCVFATNPTAMQHPLPNGAQTALAQLLREHSMFVDATNDFKDRMGPRDSSFQMGGIPRGEFRKGNPKLGIGKGLLKISGSENEGQIQVFLTLTDAAGVLLLDGQYTLATDQLEPRKFLPKETEAAVAADPIVGEINQADGEGGSYGSRMTISTARDGDVETLRVPYNPPQRKTPLSDELRRVLLSPTEMDPLAYCAGRLLDSCAEARSENLVACLDDEIFHDSVAQIGKGVKPSDYLSSKAFQQYEDVDEGSGWLTIQPRDSVAAKDRQTNRAALAQLMRSVDSNKLLLLDDICAFAQTQESAAGGQEIPLMYLRLLNPGAANGTYDPFKWYFYKFFGALTREQKQSLGAGAAIPALNLSPASRRALSQYLFRSYVEPELTKPDGTSIDAWSEGVVTDWTQLLPNGVVNSASITAKVKQEDAAYCVDTRIGAAQIVSADSLAVLQFVGDTPGLKAGATRFDRFTPATQWTYSFAIALAPGIKVKPDLTDSAINGTASNPDINSLPNSFLDRFNQRLSRYREFFGKQDFTNQGGAIPPLLF